MRGKQQRAKKRRSPLGLALLGTGLAFSLPWAAGSAAGRPEIGAPLPSLLAQARMYNAPVEVAPPKGGWVVYAFSPASPLSARNSARVEELARTLPPDWVLLSVATEAQGAPAFLERLHVTVPVLTQIPEATLAAYRISSTPRTYILDKDWKLIEVLDGAFEGKVREKLAARFKGAWKLPSTAEPVDARAAGAPRHPSSLCLDQKQSPYSPGAKANALGMTLRCGSGGVWMPVS